MIFGQFASASFISVHLIIMHPYFFTQAIFQVVVVFDHTIVVMSLHSAHSISMTTKTSAHFIIKIAIAVAEAVKLMTGSVK